MIKKCIACKHIFERGWNIDTHKKPDDGYIYWIHVCDECWDKETIKVKK